MSLYNGPPRPGARGGRGEFSWDNVKADKDREYYIGHSVKATTGRWAKGKDVFWYTRGKGDGGVAQEELEAVKAREREIMAEALGLKPKAAPKQLKQPSLEKHEVEKLLKGGPDADGAAPTVEADGIQGLGFSSKSAVAVHEEVHEVLPGTGYPAPPGMPHRQGAAAAGDALMTTQQLARLAAADDKAARKAERKDKKRKMEKKAKKEKKQKKSKRKKHKHRSSSSSSSSSSDSDQEEQRRNGYQLQRRGSLQQAVQQPADSIRQHNQHNHHQQRPATEYGGYGRASRELRPAERQQVQRPAEHEGFARSGRDPRAPAQQQHHPQSGRRSGSRCRSPVPADRRHHNRSPLEQRLQHRESLGWDEHESLRQPRMRNSSPMDSRPLDRGTAERQHRHSSRSSPAHSYRRSRSPVSHRQQRSSSPGTRGRQYGSNSPDSERRRRSRSPAAVRHGRRRSRSLPADSSRSPAKHKEQHISRQR